jgi:hypothetical protein
MDRQTIWFSSEQLSTESRIYPTILGSVPFMEKRNFEQRSRIHRRLLIHNESVRYRMVNRGMEGLCYSVTATGEEYWMEMGKPIVILKEI